MKTKKLFSIILAVILVLSALPLSALAETTIPIVVVAGYSSSRLYEFDDKGNIVQEVWGLSAKSVLKPIIKALPSLLKANIEYVKTKDLSAIEKSVWTAVDEIGEYMYRNPDGSSRHNVRTWPTKASESNMEYINANLEKNEYIKGAIHEKRYTPYLVEKLGAKNVFQFSVDWRATAIECAFNLAKYIKDVKAYTGASKVNIFSESHGGQTTGTYLSLCAITQKGGENAATLAKLLGIKQEELKDYFSLADTNNVVMNSPAIGGVQLAYDLVKGGDQLAPDIPGIVKFAETANNPLYSVIGGGQYTYEGDLELLLAGIELSFIVRVADSVIQNDGLELILSFGSIWDFLSLGYYDEIKASYLNTAEKRAAYAPIIEKSDYTHYVVMENLAENLGYARNNGVNVNIICGTDVTIATGSKTSGDSFIAAKTASGAFTTDYGYRFADGYKTDYTDSAVVCANPQHNHISPRMNLDASYAYIPENTWFIEEQYHAQYAYDEYAFGLTNEILFGSTVKDIYSSSAYPQFEATHNAKYGVHAKFDKSLYGTLTAQDSALVIKNLSNKSNIELVSIDVSGADIRFGDVQGKKIALGKSISLPFTGSVPDADMKNITVTVYFIEDNTVSPISSRTFNFTAKGGKAIAFDRSNPYVKAEPMSEGYLKDFINSLSKFDLAKQVKAIVLTLKRVITTIVNLFKLLGSKLPVAG